jgi:hypothetical protein
MQQLADGIILGVCHVYVIALGDSSSFDITHSGTSWYHLVPDVKSFLLSLVPNGTSWYRPTRLPLALRSWVRASLPLEAYTAY